MKLGVMADSHDNLDALEYWVQYFNQENVDVVLHAGDLISPFCVPTLDEFDGSVYVTFGNNDGDRETLRDMAEDTDVQFRDPPVTLDLTECTVTMAHKPSNLPDQFQASVDLAVHGHTHARKLNTDTDPVLVNPGEAGGWLSGTSSALTVTVGDGEVRPEFELVPAP